MASSIGRAAFRATRVLREAGANSGSEHVLNRANREQIGRQVLGKEAKKNPELYVRPNSSPHRTRR